jgi:hypothetical protein
LKFVIEKNQITYRSKLTKLTTHLQKENLKAKRVWGEVFQALKENNFHQRIFYPASYHS